MSKFTNSLIHEKSPYLLQHAHNPVNWLPWGEKALSKAREEDKPLFVSIGYATCHWCHVMERESFEDEEVAALLNDTFVPVKVDREERPDLDGVYMAACQLMNKSGGWPLNVFLTPEGKPFFAGTYLPKKTRGQTPGLMEMIPRVKFLWKTQRESIIESAESIVNDLKEGSIMEKGELPSSDLVNRTLRHFASNHDEKWGGFYKAPKFPMPGILLFLLHLHEKNMDPQALEMAVNSIEKMSHGGIMDHLGGGFHRYSTDRAWVLPHFEKMLYDQALLLMVYSKAWKLTGKTLFREIAEHMVEYVREEMTSPEGAFFTAEDADSEGEEGKFYLWTLDEIRNLLPADGSLFAGVYNLEKEGNFLEEATGKKTGTNILYPGKSLSDHASDRAISEEELVSRLRKCRETLLSERRKRIHPLKDDKVLTDWNGLMIASLAYAGRVMGSREALNMASGAVHFFLERMLDPVGTLYHRYRDGERAIEGFLDDHVFLAWGLVELYRGTGNKEYLESAQTITGKLIEKFWDEDNWGFFFTPSGQEDILFRRKEAYDGAILSGNAVAAQVFLQLNEFTGNDLYREKAGMILKGFSEFISRLPYSHTSMLRVLLDFHKE